MAIWHCNHPNIAMQDNRVARIAYPLEMHLLPLKCNLDQYHKGCPLHRTLQNTSVSRHHFPSLWEQYPDSSLRHLDLVIVVTCTSILPLPGTYRSIIYLTNCSYGALPPSSGVTIQPVWLLQTNSSSVEMVGLLYHWFYGRTILYDVCLKKNGLGASIFVYRSDLHF